MLGLATEAGGGFGLRLRQAFRTDVVEDDLRAAVETARTAEDPAAALDDALSTFKAVGAPAELPQLFSDLAHKGVDAGLSDQALTALVELLGND